MADADEPKQRLVLSWSSGKDSAWALYVLRSDPRVEVVGLLTTVNERHDRVAMHGVRGELLTAQARAARLPLHVVSLPDPCSNEDYEARMLAALEPLRDRGVDGFAFGDLFLEDVRRYREERTEAAGFTTRFPLWGRDTAQLAREMVDAGTHAVVTCVDPRQAPRALAGASFDHALLDALPNGVDPCGERGEFHTFVTDGPALSAPVPVERGAVVERGGFVFADLLPAGVRP